MRSCRVGQRAICMLRHSRGDTTRCNQPQVCWSRKGCHCELCAWPCRVAPPHLWCGDSEAFWRDHLNDGMKIWLREYIFDTTVIIYCSSLYAYPMNNTYYCYKIAPCMLIRWKYYYYTRCVLVYYTSKMTLIQRNPNLKFTFYVGFGKVSEIVDKNPFDLHKATTELFLLRCFISHRSTCCCVSYFFSCISWRAQNDPKAA